MVRQQKEILEMYKILTKRGIPRKSPSGARINILSLQTLSGKTYESFEASLFDGDYDDSF